MLAKRDFGATFDQVGASFEQIGVTFTNVGASSEQVGVTIMKVGASIKQVGAQNFCISSRILSNTIPLYVAIRGDLFAKKSNVHKMVCCNCSAVTTPRDNGTRISSATSITC